MAIPFESSADGGFTVPTSVSFLRMMRAIKRIPGCKIIALHYWMSIITDDCYGRFSIDGYLFDIDTVFSDYYAIIPHSPSYPKDVLDKIRTVFDDYQSFWQRLLTCFSSLFRALGFSGIGCGLVLILFLPISVYLADKHLMWFGYWAGFWFVVVLILIVGEKIRRHLKLKRQGYWAEGGKDSVTYVELDGSGTRQLEIDGEIGVVYMPSEDIWNQTMPDWAKGRRSEIEARLRKELKKYDFGS
jgi:hypothetical protein